MTVFGSEAPSFAWFHSDELVLAADVAEQDGEKLLANPALALDAITHGQATFTIRDLAMFVHRHSDGKDQFDRVMTVVKVAPELVALGKDGRDEQRFTSRAMIETEQRLERATGAMANRDHHAVADRHRDTALARAAARGMLLSPEQRGAYEHVTDAKGLGVVIGYAGTGKSAMLGVAREAWEGAGYSVHGIALSGIAAENLENSSGIASRTIASMENQWGQGRELLTNRDVLVIDEAGMIGTRQMERVITEAEKRGAKVVLVGDPVQLQAIEAGAAFRATAERHGSVEITQIRRQRDDWQRDATRQFATGRTAEAISSYDERGRIHTAETREQARGELIDRWDRDRNASPGATRIILTHTNDEVRALTVARADLTAAAREAMEAGFDLLIAAAFNFDAHASEFDRMGALTVLQARINPDLHMPDLANTGAGNLFTVFGEPDIVVHDEGDDMISIEVAGVDMYKGGQIESSDADDLAV